ncbi:MAG: ribosome small subunit-dependent GTPase A [Clostridiales Family XIII bacterium]|jgi:ribosome biogenesis GTPase|nr:ribosome small subunit-dependent GTPase A [Clostridiales Family XIII bacterium]
MRGLIVKGIAGFYYVRREDAGAGAGAGLDAGPGAAQPLYQCRARGIFKKEGLTPTVGDWVDFALLDEEEGVVNGILPRKNLFLRPPIANIDAFVVMVAAAQPKPNLTILDKFLVSAEEAGTEAILCINKTDLAKGDEASRIADIYRDIYPLVELSCADGRGLDRLPSLLKGKRSALAGPSGVGKSTLLNRLRHDTALETGAVSGKTKRGRHTTRHVELFDMDFGGMIFDTPGFTSFENSCETVSDLAGCYPEMRPYAGTCRFDDCHHLREPGCAVREALLAGRIAQSRYDSYARQCAEVGQAGRT